VNAQPNGHAPGDPLEQAIAAAEAVAFIGARVSLQSGRFVDLRVPTDITDAELLDLIAQVAVTLRGQIRAAQPASRLVLPSASEAFRK
jgi:hypothetical protein